MPGIREVAIFEEICCGCLIAQAGSTAGYLE